ncbi:MAG TPA: serine hydrolase domain-containing protein [Rhizomicrobium sp.]|nr:serine hydrolase domain-containing protein [Rhizomicrobium sp.]
MAADPKAQSVANGLLPIVRIEGQDTHWTMAERQAHYGVPAVSVAVMEGGKIAWAEGFGVLDRESKRPANGDTMYMGASTSKPVTAMLVLQHVERGILDLDVDIHTYVKSWHLPDNEFLRQSPVTLRRCLNHTAGINVNGWPCQPKGEPLSTVMELLNGGPHNPHPPIVVNKVPGGVERYSGGGLLLAQMAIEEATGRNFADLAREMIFEPLGMTRTTFEKELPARFHDTIAHGHGPESEAIPGGWLVSSEMGAGGIFTTAPDYARFMLGCRDAWLGKKGAILGKAYADQMMATYPDTSFGQGWQMIGKGPSRRMNHGGSNGGYQCEANLYLESGDGAVVMTSAVPGLFLFVEVHNGVADVYNWPEFLQPPRRIKPLDAQETANIVGEYRIVSGIELPTLKVWQEDGVIKGQIEGLRAGVQELLRDEKTGRFCSQMGPYDTTATYAADGRVIALTTASTDGTVILKAVRD